MEKNGENDYLEKRMISHGSIKGFSPMAGKGKDRAITFSTDSLKR